MEFLTDILVIAITIFALIAVMYFLFTRKINDQEEESRYTYETLKKDVKNMVNNYVSVSIDGFGLTKKAVQNQEEQRRNIAECVRICCTGNSGAREVVKDLIRNYLTRDKNINEGNIRRILPFERQKDAPVRALAECLIQHFDNGRDRGFKYLLDEYQLCSPKYDESGDSYYDITEEDIRSLYSLCGIHPSFREQLDVLVQMLYEDLFGLGVIDVLNQQKGSIEEIQIGLTGIQQNIYDYKQGLSGMSGGEQICHSKDAIHIILRGEHVRLSYLTFGTEDEKQRVIRNLIKGSEAGELTIKNPDIVVDTVDGRRISVARPPMTDTWLGFVRKFDSFVLSSLDEMYRDIVDGDIVTAILKYIVCAGYNICFTGEMAGGKTTLFRCVLKETARRLRLRVIEAGSFELDARHFLPGRNALAMRVTEWTPEEEVLAIARKTTGNLFAIGEINSLRMAVLAMAVSKISKQTLSSAHYTSTEEMIADHTNANLCIGGYTSEKLAEIDAVRSMGFDVHVKNVDGVRYIQYINEIVPEFDMERNFAHTDINEDNAAVRTAEAVREVRKQIGAIRTYSVRKILAYDERTKRYNFYQRPSAERMEKAREFMSKEKYREMIELFDLVFEDESVSEGQKELALEG